MKKLEKLTLKELESEIQVYDSYQLGEIVGGVGNGWTYETYEAYIKNEFQETYQAVCNSIEGAIDRVENFYESRKDAFANLTWSAMEESVTSWLNSIGGGTSPLGAPIIIIDSPALYPSGSGTVIPDGSYI